KLWPNFDHSGNVDWNGNGKIDPGFTVLSGDQCLVFFLAGPGGIKGWSTNPRNPLEFVDPRMGRPRETTKFYSFPADRLTRGPFPSFRDPYGTPYAYFAAYKGQEGYYDRYANIPFPGSKAAAPHSDCEGLRVSPYYSTEA